MQVGDNRQEYFYSNGNAGTAVPKVWCRRLRCEMAAANAGRGKKNGGYLEMSVSGVGSAHSYIYENVNKRNNRRKGEALFDHVGMTETSISHEYQCPDG